MTTPVPHKHAALIKQWADAPEWWDVYYREPATWLWARSFSWASKFEYKLHKSAKHPDNIKPKKRLIDWSKMPRGTLTNKGVFWDTGEELHRAYTINATSFAYWGLVDLRLKEQTEFTYWGGGECPVPDGVVIECVRRDGSVFKTAPTHPEAIAYDWQHDFGDQDIIGYRIIGLADGWTDDPEEAVSSRS